MRCHYFIVVVLIINSFNIFPQQAPPNIVLIVADDLGYECIGANGGTSYHTPNIDKLAKKGMRFENCHAQPVCTPSRVQLMTGKYNVRNYTQFAELDRTQLTFGTMLKQNGYHTAIAGKWQLGKEKDSPQHFGFEKSCLWQQSLPRTGTNNRDTRFINPILEYNDEIKEYSRGEFGPDIVSDFICDFIDENKDKPFFAYYPMLLTHCPFGTTPASETWNPHGERIGSYKGEPKYFGDMVSYMDYLVGKVVDKIETLGLAENTIIIFTGDNGTDQPIVSRFQDEWYPGGKKRTTDNGTHVPLVVRWDGIIQPSSECKVLVDFSDFLPTMMDAGNIDIAGYTGLDGQSFLPQLLGQTGEPRNWIYSWYSPSGKMKDLKEFARDTVFKLYSTNAFYNIKEDFFEEKPLSLKNLSRNEKKSYSKLKQILENYTGLRYEN